MASAVAAGSPCPCCCPPRLCITGLCCSAWGSCPAVEMWGWHRLAPQAYQDMLSATPELTNPLYPHHPQPCPAMVGHSRAHGCLHSLFPSSSRAPAVLHSQRGCQLVQGRFPMGHLLVLLGDLRAISGQGVCFHGLIHVRAETTAQK